MSRFRDGIFLKRVYQNETRYRDGKLVVGFIPKRGTSRIYKEDLSIYFHNGSFMPYCNVDEYVTI